VDTGCESSRLLEESMVRLSRRQFTIGALAMPALAGTATAQVTSIRLGKQYGLPFLPQMVMEAQKLIEKQAASLGVASLQVSWLTMSGPGALNDALLSGSIEFVNVAPPSLATLWRNPPTRRDRCARCAPCSRCPTCSSPAMPA
jgi:ABC-type nitrate/sulfonate/bicarbonate transport system substrate-binding protein